MEPSPGTRLGSYEVTAQIGQGGMGDVYRARDTKLDRDRSIQAKYVARGVCAAVSCLMVLLWTSGPELEAQGRGRFLAAWSGDEDRADGDFLAIVNVDSSSADYGHVVATVPAGEHATNPHHTEHAFASGHTLFASGFAGNRIFRFDLANPLAPTLAGSVAIPSGFAFSHSFERLPSGHVLATMQAQNGQRRGPGGIIEYRDDGTVIRVASAHADGATSTLRPYSLAPVPEHDRLVTASNRMGVPPWHPLRGVLDEEPRGADIQLWCLSDLTLLRTIALPASGGLDLHLQPNEPRVLQNGTTVLVTTARCGLWKVGDLEAETFAAELVYDFEARGCAVPLSVGHFWIQSVGSTRQVVVLDVQDSSHPVKVSHAQFDDQQLPHWLAFDERESRIVMVNAPGDAIDRRIWMLDFDEETGRLTLDESFGNAGSDRPGVNFDRAAWPHGVTGAAIPHGSVFLN